MAKDHMSVAADSHVHNLSDYCNGNDAGGARTPPPAHGFSPPLPAPEGVPNVPVAICGMGMRLPGGIRNDSDLFRFLVEQRDARKTVPSSRYNVDAFYNAHSKPGTVAARHGYFLQDADLAKTDASMFSMTAAELSRVDPSQRLLLEVVREAFETAGVADFKGKNIGTYASVYSEDWQDLQNRDFLDAGPYQLTGKMDFMLGNRIAYEYDLRGPSMTLKTACSSSGLALHQALQSIRLGEVSSALVAGANLLLAPGLAVTMSATQALSPTGSCKTFDASADGYARAEGVSCLYIKRLDEAIRDGNPIRAVIRASSSNADGKTTGLTVPNPAAQEALIRQAYRNAGLELCHTPVIECHGTGTPTGDPPEISAIASCFSEHGAYIGSVKPNLGHSEGASALTSILKAVVALENRTIIPNIKFNTPNPAIQWDAAKLTVPTEPLPWPHGRNERIGVNSFGFGGSNVHFILDSAKSFGIPPPNELVNPHRQSVAKKTLLLFSANSKESLEAVAKSHHAFLQESPDQLESLAYTLAERREHLKLRTFSVTDGKPPFQLIGPIKTLSRGPGHVAFIFTGQGAQWIGMGRGLMREWPVFRQTIAKVDAVLQSLDHAPSWTIEDILSSCEDETMIRKAEISQPVCTALQLALVDLLAVWGVTPSVVMGHSSGEIAAAYAAIILSLRESAIVAFYRGFVCEMAGQTGGMAAVGLGREAVQPYVAPGVQIACENSGNSVTLSGEVASLEATMASVKTGHPGVLARRLHVDMAYHSDHMRKIGAAYYDVIQGHLEPKTPRVAFVSSVKAEPLSEASDFGPQYWKDNMENPVLFHSAVKRLLAEFPEASTHVEVGPHQALAGPLRQTYAEKAASAEYLSCLTRGKDDAGSFLETMGRLHCLGLHARAPVSSTARVLKQLPTYPWNYKESYWAESRVMSSWRFRQHAAHDLLGSRITETSDLEPSWRNVLRVADIPWLRDHCVGSDMVFPAAGYLAMVGEAISQLGELHDAKVGYTVRQVHFVAAMLLRDDKSTEVITTLRPRMLTARIESPCYEFSVVSHDGSTWTRHCHGLVIGGCAAHMQAACQVQTFTRRVSPDRWYKAMARSGLNYGPRFMGLCDVTAAVSKNIASAKVVNAQEPSESRYALHPTTIDAIFQSLTVARSKGFPRCLKSPSLPTFIEQVSVGAAPISATIDVVTLGDDQQASSHGMVHGKTVFDLRLLKGARLGQADTNESGGFAAQHLQWKPAADFADTATLMKRNDQFDGEMELPERLFVLCAAEAKKSLIGVEPSQPHFAHFLSWLDEQLERFRQPGYPLVQDSAYLVGLTSEERLSIMSDCVTKAESAESRPLVSAVWRAYSQLAEIIDGRVDYLNLLLQDDLLQQVYDWTNNRMDLGDVFSLVGNSQPQLTILEIGAGTGGLTSKMLQSLRSDYGERLFLRYVFTDISSGFFVKAQERFQDHDGVEYRVLDISRDPVEQGFGVGEYDLVLASNVLHATPVLAETLKNCLKLLKPRGRLFLQELSPVSKSMNFVMGLFSGWWLGGEDGRVKEPYISPTKWDAKLREAGFAGVESVVLDGEAPYHLNANMIARPATETVFPKALTLLIDAEGPGPLAQATKNLLESRGCRVDPCMWGKQVLPPDQDVISFIDVEGRAAPLLRDIGADGLEEFLKLVDSVPQSVILWLTKAAQINCQDPHQAQILGMARTIRAELAVDMATMELEHPGEEAAPAVVDVMRNLMAQTARQRAAMDDNELDVDMEYAWVDGAVYLSRFHWFPVVKALADAPRPSQAEAKRLVVGQRGILESLHWREQDFKELGPMEVRVQMATIGMNFRELVLALGVITESAGEPDGSINAFGAEGTGCVTEVGVAVQHLQIGDLVMTLGSRTPGFATRIQQHADNCVKIPPGLGDAEAASMPAAYFTVLHCLIDKANLRREQSVLVHSAAGGVGIAAIHVARWLGAEIFATAGSEAKADFLVRELGVARERIFSSRDASFVDGIMQATAGVGVDVVLNSLAGELLHASWRCVAPNGTMVEIGKRDVLGHGQLAMVHFQDNRTFTCVDASKLIQHPPTARRLLQQMVQLYEKGCISPIRPLTIFDAANVGEAYRYMQQGQHVGKIIVKFPENIADLMPTAPPSVPDPSFRAEVSYLLVGGTGGLGQAVASWMVHHGARSLIFLSPSAGRSAAHGEFFAELQEAGCAVQCYAGDVADPALVRTAIEQARPPIAGVMQMSMVLRDVGIMDMDVSSWTAAVRPKIEGTWNLHRQLSADLDFFVLFSSMAGLFGYFGQSNYSSANTFLDAFVQYRHAMGLVASVVDIGPVDDVGFVARTPGSLTNIVEHAHLVGEQDLLKVLQLAITPTVAQKCARQATFCNVKQLGLIPACKLSITDPSNTTIWKRDARMAIYRNISQAPTAAGESEASDPVRAFMSSLLSDPGKLDSIESPELLTLAIGARVSAFVMRDADQLDTTQTLAAAGVDSLVAIELRNWWKQRLGVDVTVLELLNGGSIKQLGDLAIRQLKAKYCTKS